MARDLKPLKQDHVYFYCTDRSVLQKLVPTFWNGGIP